MPYLPKNTEAFLVNVQQTLLRATPRIENVNRLQAVSALSRASSSSTAGKTYVLSFEFSAYFGVEYEEAEPVLDAAALYLTGKTVRSFEQGDVADDREPSAFFPPAKGDDGRVDGSGWPLFCDGSHGEARYPYMEDVAFPILSARAFVTASDVCGGGFSSQQLADMWVAQGIALGEDGRAGYAPPPATLANLRFTEGNVDVCAVGLDEAPPGAEFEDGAIQDPCPVVGPDMTDGFTAGVGPPTSPPGPPQAATPVCFVTDRPDGTRCSAPPQAQENPAVLYSLFPEGFVGSEWTKSLNRVRPIYEMYADFSPCGNDELVDGRCQRHVDAAESMMAALDYGPAILSFRVCDEMQEVGVASDPNNPLLCPPSGEGGHAVVLVGYHWEGPDAWDKNHWIIQNSWGASWGDRGFGYLLMRRLGVSGVSLPLVRLRDTQPINPLLPPLPEVAYRTHQVDGIPIRDHCAPPCLSSQLPLDKARPTVGDLGSECRSLGTFVSQVSSLSRTFVPFASVGLSPGETLSLVFDQFAPTQAVFSALRLTLQTYDLQREHQGFYDIYRADGERDSSYTNPSAPSEQRTTPSPIPPPDFEVELWLLRDGEQVVSADPTFTTTVRTTGWRTQVSDSPPILEYDVDVPLDMLVAELNRTILRVRSVSTPVPYAACVAKLAEGDWTGGNCEADAAACPSGWTAVSVDDCTAVSHGCQADGGASPTPVCCIAPTLEALRSKDASLGWFGVKSVGGVGLDLSSLQGSNYRVAQDDNGSGPSLTLILAVTGGTVGFCCCVACLALVACVVVRGQRRHQHGAVMTSHGSDPGAVGPRVLSSRSRRSSQSRGLGRERAYQAPTYF
jgi:hypothetical protein